MGSGTATAADVSVIAAMVTPALFILGSASLVAAALVRMGRVVDRVRVLAALAREHDAAKAGAPAAAGAPAPLLARWLDRHRRRARYAQGSIVLLYTAIVVFVACCLSIAIVRTVALAPWLPPALAIIGALLMLGGAVLMVGESRLSGRQVDEEIDQAMRILKAQDPAPEALDPPM
jgi:hypothetical protein